MHHRDGSIGERHRGVAPEGRVLPVGDLPEKNVGDGLRVEAEAGDVGHVERHDDRPDGTGEVEDGYGEAAELLVRNGIVAGTEVRRSGGGIGDARTAADRGVVNADVRLALVKGLDPLRIQGKGKRGAGAIEEHCGASSRVQGEGGERSEDTPHNPPAMNRAAATAVPTARRRLLGTLSVHHLPPSPSAAVRRVPVDRDGRGLARPPPGVGRPPPCCRASRLSTRQVNASSSSRVRKRAAYPECRCTTRPASPVPRPRARGWNCTTKTWLLANTG